MIFFFPKYYFIRKNQILHLRTYTNICDTCSNWIFELTVLTRTVPWRCIFEDQFVFWSVLHQIPHRIFVGRFSSIRFPYVSISMYVSRKRYQSIDGTTFLPLTAANINLSRRSFNFRNYYVRKTKLVISTYVILNWEKFQCIISNEVCLSTGLYHLRQLCRLKTLLFSLGGSLHHHLPSNNNTKTQIENEGEWIYYLLFEIWHWWHMVWNIGITAIGRKKRKRWRDIVKKLSTTKEREREREMMCYIQTDRYLDPNFISLESKEE